MKAIGDYFLWTMGLLLFMAHGGMCEDNSDDLPNWLVGTIAVCAFLILAFAFMLVNHYYCANMFEEEEDELDEETGYENHVLEIDEGMPTERIEGLKSFHTYEKVDEKSDIAEAEEEPQYSEIDKSRKTSQDKADLAVEVYEPAAENVMSTAL